jgi:hypothetical protein
MIMLTKVVLSGKPLDKMGLEILEKLCLIFLSDFEKMLTSYSTDTLTCEGIRKKAMQFMGRHLEFLTKLQPVIIDCFTLHNHMI